MQVFGEVFVQTGSRQRGKQDDSQQYCHCAGTQPAVGQDGGVSVRVVDCGCFACLFIQLPILTHLRSLAEMAAATSVHVVTIVEPIIQHADWFFPEGELWLSFPFVIILLTLRP